MQVELGRHAPSQERPKRFVYSLSESRQEKAETRKVLMPGSNKPNLQLPDGRNVQCIHALGTSECYSTIPSHM